jgi:hypothetical protein
MDQEPATDLAQATGRRMKGSGGGASRLSRTRHTVVVAALALLGLAAAAQPALAANHDIHMTAPTRVPLGQSGLIRIDGVVAPPAEFWDESWIEVVALPGNLGPECPGDAQSAGSIAEESGNILAIALRPSTDEAGNFVNSVSFTARGVGPVMICGYLYNEVGYTWAGAMLRLEAVPPDGGPGVTGPPTGPGGSGGGPVSVRRPWVTHTGSRLVCHKGAWSSARSYAYNWYVDGSLRRETSPRPVAPVPAYLGHRFSCKVTAYGPGGSTSAMSPTIRLR